MPTPLAAVPSDSPVGQQKKGAQSSVQRVPFARSSKWHIEQGNTVSNIAINVASPGTFNFTLPSYGYLSCVYLSVTTTGGAGAGTFFEDAPWSVISSILLTDVNGVPIWGPFSGYSAFLASKYGGYRMFAPDVLAVATANAVALPFGQIPTSIGFTSLALGNQPLYSSNATGGTFSFILPIFLEFGRDGLGALPNSDASARYNLQVTLGSGLTGTQGPLYTTQPAGSVPTVNMQVEVLCRSQPPAADIFGNQNSISPPAVGTVQYWSQQTFPSLSGSQTLQLSRVGNLIRNHILVFRDSAGGATPRATAESTDMPTTIEFDWDVGVRYIANVATQRMVHYQGSGLGPPNGVVIYPNTLDPDKLAISEFGDEWMATVGASKLGLRFTPSAASPNLTVLTNDIVPASGQVYAAPALQGGY